MAYLNIERQVFPLRAEHIIGRQSSCDIPIDSFYASKQHAKLKSYGGDKYLLTDMNSKNGVFVNGERIREYLLTGGETVRIGDVSGTFRMGTPEHMCSGFQTVGVSFA